MVALKIDVNGHRTTYMKTLNLTKVSVQSRYRPEIVRTLSAQHNAFGILYA